MRFLLTAGLVLSFWVGPLAVRGDGHGPLAGQLDLAESLLGERKFDESLAVLREVVARQGEDRASAALAQYRIGLYLGWIKEHAKDRAYWLSQVETELRKVATDFPEQAEAVGLSRVKLVDALVGQGKLDDARQVAQVLRETTPDRPEYQAWARLKLVEVSLAIRPGMEGSEIRAAQLAAIPELEQVVGMSAGDFPEVANWARVRLLGTLAAAWQFEPIGAVCQAVLADHAAGRASDKQAAWALILRADALARQNRHEDAIEPLGMAIAVADPHHLDLKYRAEGDLRKVYGALTDREYKAGEEALFRDRDYVTARFRFEAAHRHALLAGGHRLEPIRMHLARLAQEAEEYDRAIAWWRMVIPNPLDLGGGAIEAADVIAWLFREKMGQPQEEKRWRQYLVNPGYPDPTAAIVLAELGTTPGATPEQQQPVEGLQRRLSAMLALYENENRLGECRMILEETLASAKTDAERAEILNKIAYCRMKLEGRLQGKETALEAADLWVSVVLTSDSKTAHYAMERAAVGLIDVKCRREALATAERIVQELAAADAPLNKLAFARLNAARALGLWNYRPAEAAQAALQLADELADAQEPLLEMIRVLALLDASIFRAGAGEPFAGLDLLDQVEAMFPGKYQTWIAAERKRVSDYYLSIGSSCEE